MQSLPPISDTYKKKSENQCYPLFYFYRLFYPDSGLSGYFISGHFSGHFISKEF